MMKYRNKPAPEKPAPLPKTRREQFADVLKNDTALLVNLSLICFLFSLPFLLTVGVGYLLIAGAEAIKAETVFPVAFWGGLIGIPFAALRFAARAAAFGVMKKRVWNEGCFVWQSFYENLCDGFGKKFACGALRGTSLWIALLAAAYLPGHSSDAFALGLGLGIAILQYALIAVSSEYFAAQQSLYVLSFGDCFRNAVSFTVMHFPASLLCFAATVALPVFLFSLHPLIGVAVVFLAALGGTGTAILAEILYAFSRFDTYINSTNYPDYVKKGLHIEEDSHG